MAEKTSTTKYTASTNPEETSLRRTDGYSNRRRRVKNYLLIWVDANVTTSNEDSQNSLEQIRRIFNDVNVFSEPDDCINFLTDIQLEKVFLIVSNSLGRDLVPCIHLMTQVDAIYIFCDEKSQHEEWMEQWAKVKGIYTQIEPICEALELAVKQCNQDSIPVSFAPISGEDASDINLNQLEPSFMYTQLFKKTLLEMEHNRDKEVQDLVKYWQETYAGNCPQLKLIEEFSCNYHQNKAIWWYTRDAFVYDPLNRALRLLEADIIVKMGFFICDLHQQIEQLHKEQVGRYGGTPFVVYRGQRLSNSDFEELRKTQGGLMSFNGFLSTSANRDASLMFAGTITVDNDKIAILFVITIDPKIVSTPFADIRISSQFRDEAEILFSTHTVFRINDIEPIQENGGVFVVNLTMTTDDDMQLRTILATVDAEVQAYDGSERMGRLLLKLGQPNKAEELYSILLEQGSQESDQRRYYHHLGCIKTQQGDYEEAMSFYARELVILQKSVPANHPLLAANYSSIALVYDHMGKHSKALSYYEKALDIWRKNLPDHHSDLATSYNNIGVLYNHMGECSAALCYHEKALEIWKENLPANHPSLATSYQNIGFVNDKMGAYSNALSFYEQALKIWKKSHSANHPSWAGHYNNIGLVYDGMGKYSKALSFYERALQIANERLSENHPDLASANSNVGSLYDRMGEYSKALPFYELALAIRQKSLRADHPELAASYNNIGSVYDHMGEYSKALSSHEKALEIWEKSLPADHPDLAASCNNIGSVYCNMGECSKALSFWERALAISQKSLPANHPSLATSYNNIGAVHDHMGEYSSALPFYKQALGMRQQNLPDDHPDLAASYNNIGSVYYKMGECSKALSFCEQALEIWKKKSSFQSPSLRDLLQQHRNGV